MKLLLICALVLLCACSGPRYGCGTENYKHPFRVERISPTNSGYTITLRSVRWGKRYMVCCSLPDSIRIGSIVNI